MDAEPGEEPKSLGSRHNIWSEGGMHHEARQNAMEFRRERQLARQMHEAEEMDQEHDPDQILQNEEWEEIVEEAQMDIGFQSQRRPLLVSCTASSETGAEGEADADSEGDANSSEACEGGGSAVKWCCGK